MNFPEEKVIKAFQMYTTLARNGKGDSDMVQYYKADNDIRALLDSFSHEVDSVIIMTSGQMFLVPTTKLSPFHVSNDWIKRNYLKSGATNGDIFLLYFSIIVLIGCFYDSYQGQDPTRQFIGIDEWAQVVNERVNFLTSHEDEDLKELEMEFSYNWRLIIEKWTAMDDIKETAKKQSGSTISRLSFIDTVKRFLVDQGLIQEIGNDEITLTEKTKTIVQRYFMEVEYNKGIFEFIYGFERGEDNAVNQ